MFAKEVDIEAPVRAVLDLVDVPEKSFIYILRIS